MTATEQGSPDPITVTIKEASHRTGLSTQTIYTICNKGAVASVYFGRKRLVNYASLRAYVDALPVDPAAA